MKSIQFESAQNVKIEFEFASSVQRAVAALLDGVVMIIYLIIFLSAVSYSGWENYLLVELLLLKLPFIFYHPILEYLAQGQTLGKYIMGIRVVTYSGERPGLREIFTRWIFKGYFLWISFTFSNIFQAGPDLLIIGSIQLSIGFIGFLISTFSERHQRMGDVMANTVVIRNRSNVRYSLRDVLAIKNQENYKPEYPNAVVFTDEDMLLIKNTIQRVKANPNPETKKFAIELADKSAQLMGLPETPAKRLKFLQTLLQDYVVLTR